MAGWKTYYYNENDASRTLHLFGCCTNSRYINAPNIKFFDTENEVLAYAGLSFKWCEKCLEQRERMLYEAIKEREGE